MRNVERVVLLGIVGLFFSGCSKSTSGSADSVALVDKDAASAEILRADSAWMRHAQAKHVDSLMPYYAPEAVSMSEGTKLVKGTNDIRSSYSEMLKANFRDMTFKHGGVQFSDDGTMAWDYGTFTGTVDGPNGKPMKVGGNALNVWKKIDGRWVMVAEISNSAPGA